MTARRDQYQPREGGCPWAIVVLLVIACLITGYALAPSRVQSDASPRPIAFDPTLVALQKTAFVPTATRTVSPTSTPRPTALPGPTMTPTTTLDYCSVTGLETPCVLPAAPAPRETDVPVCWVEVTPRPDFVTVCRKLDAGGTSGEAGIE